MPKKEFWDLDENKNFISIRSPIDDLHYKVYSESQKQTLTDKNTAKTLSRVRREINKLVYFLYTNPEIWQEKYPEIKLLIDIHLPCLYKLNIDKDYKFDANFNIFLNTNCANKLVNIMEMSPNPYGLIGLNKPKRVNKNGVATKRSLHLTIRDKNGIIDFDDIMKLVLHEIAHTACNDVKWKKNNHLYPFYKYYSFLVKTYEKYI